MKETCTCPSKNYTINPPVQYGWKCPCCGAVMAPWQNTCTNCVGGFNKWTVTCGGDTTTGNPVNVQDYTTTHSKDNFTTITCSNTNIDSIIGSDIKTNLERNLEKLKKI